MNVITLSKVRPARVSALALAWTLPLLFGISTVLATVPAQAKQSAPADGPAELMRQAAALEKAEKWQAAAKAYEKAAKAYEAKGQDEGSAQASKKAATMYENYANSLLGGGQAAPATPAAPPAEPAQGTAPAQPAAEPARAAAPFATGGAPAQSPDASSIVYRDKYGRLSVASASGKPVNGVKLSRHDLDIHNPSIVVSSSGAIHVAFVESLKQSPYPYGVYHRVSTDGGHSWSEAKNLSEALPDYQIGNCRIAADGAGRIYVIWRSAFGPGGASSANNIVPHSQYESDNLVYRVLENGAWSGKAIVINPPVDPQKQTHGVASWFAATDPNGRLHVYWGTDPEPLHPEALLSDHSHSPNIGLGEILETTLTGQSVAPAREFYHTPIVARASDDNPQGWATNESLNEINGYVDAIGQGHLLVQVSNVRHNEPRVRYALVENGKMTPEFDLPGALLDYGSFPPALLVDAQGKRHAIVMHSRGEPLCVHDYTLGSGGAGEPTVIRSVKGANGALEGVEAFQGPGGKMIALLQMNDTGKDTDDDLYVTTCSGGGKWSVPVNVTNNAARATSASDQFGTRSHSTRESIFLPGPAAAAFDKSGHLAITYVAKEKGLFAAGSFGNTAFSGSTVTPQLLFLRF